MELLEYLLYLFIGGLILGAIARLFVSGTGGMGIVATAAAGVAGSIVAGLLVRYVIEPKEDWVGIVIAIICAAVFVALFSRGARQTSY